MAYKAWDEIDFDPRPLSLPGEQWEPIFEADDYLISDQGRVLNTMTGSLMAISQNQTRSVHVGLWVNGHGQIRRSIALLVAKAFLPDPPRKEFNTPINLNGDRFDNRAVNLQWRPRWFALKYHAQYLEKMWFPGAVEDMKTSEYFENVRLCAMKFGLLEQEIVHSAHNRTPVFPTWQEFRLVKRM